MAKVNDGIGCIGAIILALIIFGCYIAEQWLNTMIWKSVWN